MATAKLKTSQRENHTPMTQRPGALELAAEGTPLNAAPAERARQKFCAAPPTAAAAQLVNCKGFITVLPIHWVENENVQIQYPTAHR